MFQRPLRALVVLVLARGVALLALGTATAQCDPQWQPGDPVAALNGNVEAMTLWDPDGVGPLPLGLVASGSFSLGGAFASVVTYDGSQWASLGAFNTSQSCTALFNGQLIVGGDAVRSWNGSAWQTIGTLSAGGRIRAMTVFQGDLIVAGGFTTINGAPTAKIARWNGSSWSGLGSGITGNWVFALAVHVHNSAPALYVGGDFTAAGGIALNHLAIWNGITWAASANPNGRILSLGVRSTATATTSYLFAGGSFTAIGGVAAQAIARFNASSNTWTALGAGIPFECQSLFVRGTGLTSYQLLAGANGQVWQWGGVAWNTVGPNLAASPLALTYYGGQYVVGLNTFPNVAGAVRTFDGTEWQPLRGAGIDDTVNAVLPVDTGVVIGGAFRTISGVVTNGVARGTANAWSPLGGGVLGSTGDVRALARLANGHIVAGGSFTVASGAVANNIAVWNGSAWAPLGGGTSGEVNALLVLPGGDLIAAGSFGLAGATSAASIARWNGTVWSPLGNGLNGRANALALLGNGDLIVGGAFTTAGGPGNTVNRVARWAGSTWHALGTGMSADVRTLAVMPNGDMIAGGDFQQAGGVAATHLARWSNGTWQPATTGTTGQLSTSVHTLLALPNGDLLVGGPNFLVPGPITTYGSLLRLRDNAWERMSVGGPVYASAFAPHGDVVIGGDIYSVANLTSSKFARQAVTCPATVVSYGTGCAGANGTLALTATSQPWIGGTYRATATGLSPGALVFDVLGFSAQSTPLSVFHPAGGPGCNLLVNSLAVQLLLASNGIATTQIAVPNQPGLVGLQLRDQVLQVQLSGAQTITGLHGSNALHLTVGSL